MPGRLLTLQRQARELGRLRTGYTDGKRPVRSDTWIVSSHAEHYIQAAADAWGGNVEKWQPQGGGAAQWRVRTEAVSLDALLPPGDPLSQSLELWSGGGCARRCDGITEQLSDSPCLCVAKHGDAFHEQPKGSVCSATTRLNVFLPDMPDVGVWRAETHSFYSAQEIAGAVDLMKSAVGPDAVIPIRLRIEQRQRKAGGQTKKFPVIVMELRGISTGDVLAGSVMGGALPASKQREAIEAAPVRAIESIPEKVLQDRDSVRDALIQVANHGTIEDLRQLWPDAKGVGLEDMARGIAEDMNRLAQADAESAELRRAANSTVDGRSVDDLWAEIMRTVPEDWPTSKVEEEFTKSTGVSAETAEASDMQAYLISLRGAK